MLKTQQYQNYSRKAHSSQLQQIKECDIQNRVTQNRPIFSLKFIAEINSSKHSQGESSSFVTGHAELLFLHSL